MKEGNFKLQDGRNLAYAEYGSGGNVILYFHGTPSSRLEPTLLLTYGMNAEELVSSAGFRLIAIDRPGIGRSDPDPQNDFISVAHDAKQLLDHLLINSCSVLCWSGGGPFALAMAYSFPKLVRQVSVICGFSKPFSHEIISRMGMNKWYFRFSRFTPGLVKVTMNFFRKRPINHIPPQWITGLPDVDYKLIRSIEDFRELARLSMKEAARNGATGPVAEARSYYKPLGFDISVIQTQVDYWWGTKDMSVIRMHAEEVESKIPKAIMHYREGEGHLSLYVNHFKDVVQKMKENLESAR